MNDLLSKISSYHLFNYLLPGCLFAISASKLTHRGFVQQNIVLGLFLYYFYGLVISRIGSLVIEPPLRKIGLLKMADYGQFVAACKKDPKIDVLSETNNMYRTISTLLIVLMALLACASAETKWPYLMRAEKPVAFIALLVMFVFSYRKQTAYISKRVQANQEAA